MKKPTLEEILICVVVFVVVVWITPSGFFR
jgi:hypothetical protein